MTERGRGWERMRMYFLCVVPYSPATAAGANQAILIASGAQLEQMMGGGGGGRGVRGFKSYYCTRGRGIVRYCTREEHS